MNEQRFHTEFYLAGNRPKAKGLRLALCLALSGLLLMLNANLATPATRTPAPAQDERPLSAKAVEALIDKFKEIVKERTEGRVERNAGAGDDSPVIPDAIPGLDIQFMEKHWDAYFEDGEWVGKMRSQIVLDLFERVKKLRNLDKKRQDEIWNDFEQAELPEAGEGEEQPDAQPADCSGTTEKGEVVSWDAEKGVGVLSPQKGANHFLDRASFAGDGKNVKAGDQVKFLSIEGHMGKVARCVVKTQ